MAKTSSATDTSVMAPDPDTRTVAERIADAEAAVALELASQRKANAHVNDPKTIAAAAKAIQDRDAAVERAVAQAHDELAAAMRGQAGTVRIVRA